MENRIAYLVIDATDAERLARFWADVLGWRIVRRGSYWVTIGHDDGPVEINFRSVPDRPASQKNRLHLDIKPVRRSQPDELRRLVALGAREVDVGQRPDANWAVLADPEGNEFCLCLP
jgi:predicted enzyme related to lactoylglutathione lyase